MNQQTTDDLTLAALVLATAAVSGAVATLITGEVWHGWAVGLAYVVWMMCKGELREWWGRFGQED